VLLELALALPQPRIAPLTSAPNDLVRVELKRHPIQSLGLGLAGGLRPIFLTAHLLAGLAEELAPAIWRA
jgi:hypothetical protein